MLTPPCEAVALFEQAGHLVVTLSDGTMLGGRAVIVATGARYRRLDVDRLADLEGAGMTPSGSPDRRGDPSMVVNDLSTRWVVVGRLPSWDHVVVPAPDLAMSEGYLTAEGEGASTDEGQLIR